MAAGLRQHKAVAQFMRSVAEAANDLAIAAAAASGKPEALAASAAAQQGASAGPSVGFFSSVRQIEIIDRTNLKPNKSSQSSDSELHMPDLPSGSKPCAHDPLAFGLLSFPFSKFDLLSFRSHFWHCFVFCLPPFPPALLANWSHGLPTLQCTLSVFFFPCYVRSRPFFNFICQVWTRRWTSRLARRQPCTFCRPTLPNC